MQGCVVLIGLPIRCVGLQSLFKLGVALIKLASQYFVSTDKCFTKLGGGIPHGRSCSGSRRAAHIKFSALSQRESGWAAYRKSCKHINTITLSGICYPLCYITECKINVENQQHHIAISLKKKITPGNQVLLLM